MAVNLSLTAEILWFDEEHDKAAVVILAGDEPLCIWLVYAEELEDA